MGVFLGLGASARAEEGMPKDDGMQMSEAHGWDKGGWEDGCKKACDLSDSQSGKVKDLCKKQRKESQSLCDQINVDEDTLKMKLNAKADDDTIKGLLAKIDAEKEKLETIRDGYRDQLDAILSPSQQAKFLLAKEGCCKMGMGCSMGKMGKGDSKGEDSSDHKMKDETK